MNKYQSCSKQITKNFNKALPNIWKKAEEQTAVLLKREVEMFGNERKL